MSAGNGEGNLMHIEVCKISSVYTNTSSNVSEAQIFGFVIRSFVTKMCTQFLTIFLLHGDFFCLH